LHERHRNKQGYVRIEGRAREGVGDISTEEEEEVEGRMKGYITH
jgi:uncharacterized protein YjbJ (UPF0337 family)